MLPSASCRQAAPPGRRSSWASTQAAVPSTTSAAGWEGWSASIRDAAGGRALVGGAT